MTITITLFGVFKFLLVACLSLQAISHIKAMIDKKDKTKFDYIFWLFFIIPTIIAIIYIIRG
jgi:TRAP-type mannitol/chloroaromatic compound transport system permease small subunit